MSALPRRLKLVDLAYLGPATADTLPGAMRIEDDERHLWPRTGHWCRTCRMPLHAYLIDQGLTVHPGCDGGAA